MAAVKLSPVTGRRRPLRRYGGDRRSRDPFVSPSAASNWLTPIVAMQIARSGHQHSNVNGHPNGSRHFESMTLPVFRRLLGFFSFFSCCFVSFRFFLVGWPPFRAPSSWGLVRLVLVNFSLLFSVIFSRVPRLDPDGGRHFESMTFSVATVNLICFLIFTQSSWRFVRLVLARLP